MNNRINGSVAGIVDTIKKHSIFYKNIRYLPCMGSLGHWTFLWQFTTFTASRMSSLRKFLEFLLSPASLMRRSGILTVHLFYMIKQEYSLCYDGVVINQLS